MNLAQINSGLIFFITITILTGEKLNNSSILNDLRFSNYVFPVHYNIKLSVLFEKYDSNETQSTNIRKEHRTLVFYGNSGITVNIFHSTQIIKVDILNDVTNNWRLIKSDDTSYATKKCIHNTTTNILDIHFFDILSPGLYTLKTEVANHITNNDTESFFRNSYINKEGDLIWLITPYNQMIKTCQLFPCWKESNLMTTFIISIKHDSDFVALSNMPIRAQYKNNNLTWTTFCATPPISIHQISIIVTNFLRIRINTNIFLWCEKCGKLQLRSLQYAKQIIKNVTLHLESQFDKIKIPKMDHVVIPNFPDENTSKWGLIFHREADLIYDEKLDPVMRKIEITRSIASKIAYQWFGNAITSICWSWFQFDNGLAELFGEETTIKIFNNSQLMDFFIVQNQYDILLVNINESSLIFNQSHNYPIFSFLSYTKVIALLRELQNIVTDAFQKNVCVYLYKHMFISVITDNFWSIREDRAAPYQYFKSNDFLAWIIMNDTNCPILNLEQKYSSFRYFIQYFNTTDYGYYELPTNWDKIVYLNIEKYKNLSVPNRAKIINDAFELMVRGQSNVSTFWKVTKYLSHEIDYSAWYPMIKMFEFISSAFPLSKEAVNFILIKEEIKELLSTSLEILGFDESPMENDLIKCLRQEIAKWACIVEHFKCLLKAKFKLEQHLEHPEVYKILPGWKRWTYCKGLMMVDSLSWPYLRHIWSDKPNSKYVEFLTCFQDNHFLNKLFTFLKLQNLEESRQNATKEDINTCIKIFHSIVANCAKNDYAFEIMLLNFTYIKPTEISKTAALVDIINHVYSAKQLDKIRDMLEHNKMVLHLERLASKVYRKIETRWSEIKSLIFLYKNFLYFEIKF